MFNGSYFGARYFAPRYFPKFGAVAAVIAYFTGLTTQRTLTGAGM